MTQWGAGEWQSTYSGMWAWRADRGGRTSGQAAELGLLEAERQGALGARAGSWEGAAEFPGPESKGWGQVPRIQLERLRLDLEPDERARAVYLRPKGELRGCLGQKSGAGPERGGRASA